MATEKEIREVKRRHSPQLLNRPGVCGVGVEKDKAGDYVLAVHLDTENEDALAALPEEIEGYPVKYIYSGPFRKLPAEEKT
ncbi:MAG: hypothetical protein ACR2GW_14135 [Pyrinomonadaceae bacterium]|nr:hypothetical protein [Pyrinomonadaceae bacterium]MDQ3584582.1 hypothetical protein [Acidobacteriota bacterium]